MIRENIQAIKEELEDVSLIAVTKKRSLAEIQELYNLGEHNFGENRVQELLSKIQLLPNDIHWHLIGHLQRNKVNQVVGVVSLIQSVDSVRLIKEINKVANKKNIVQSILLQVHIATEIQKYGFRVDELKKFISGNYKEQYQNIHFAGLMGMATFTSESKIIEGEFKFLSNLYNEMKTSSNAKQFKHLSMGMSGDYKLAIKNGANMVRIGSKIFK